VRVTLLELPARYGKPQVALDEVRSALTLGPATDLVLLPEASLTGYVSPALDFDLARFAEPVAGPTAQALQALAREFHVHLAAPLIEQADGHCFNTLVGFAPDGTRFLHYRKRHPWMPETWATPGDLPWPKVEAGGLKFTAAVCFDVHFLEEEAADALTWADVLLFPSAWVQSEPDDTRTPQLAGLAQRFDVAIVNANWGPGAPAVPGQGGSCVVARDGAVTRVTPGRVRLDAVVEPTPR
jgi:predicted amidohydrolase